jgi:hypothetical protein
MTPDEIIELAREAGFTDGMVSIVGAEGFANFAALVAAAEREACAKVCDQKVDAEYATGKVDHNEMGWTQACAIDIRSRGQE